MKLATLCYVRDQSRTLMLHRIKKANDMHAGKWNGLGGKLEPGETPEECVLREVREESGLTLLDPRLRGLMTFPQFSQGEDWYCFLFTATRFTGELIDSAEGELRWIDDGDLLQLNLWPGDRIFMRWLDDERFFSAKFLYQAGELTKYEVVFYTQSGERFEEAEDFTRRASADVKAAELRAGVDARPGFEPVYSPKDDTICWLCGGPVFKRHCKIVCTVCGFMRDCSDP